jgi:hypothetical protein
MFISEVKRSPDAALRIDGPETVPMLKTKLELQSLFQTATMVDSMPCNDP